MSFFKKKSGSGGGSLKGAQAGTEVQLRDSLVELQRGATGAGKLLNTAQSRFNPNQSQNLFNQGLGRFANFDQQAQQAEQQAYDANYAPILSQIKTELGNQFSGMGSAGRNNSRGMYAQAALGQQLANNAGSQLLGIRQQARNNLLNENQALLNPAMGIQQQVAGFDMQKANNLTNLAQGQVAARQGFTRQTNSLASQQAQMDAQGRSQRKSGVGSLIGGGISLAGSMFSDERLKENIKPLITLNNGVKIYSYNYKGQKQPSFGVIAQEIQLTKPQAVEMDESGYLKVNYEEVFV